MNIIELLARFGVSVPDDVKSAFLDEFLAQFVPAEMQTAAEKENARIREELDMLLYRAAADRLLSGYSFSGELAQEAVLGRVTAARLPLEDGALTGGAELMEALKEENPWAFEGMASVPRLIASTPGKAGRTQAGQMLRAAFGLPE